jgi:hypothetical protein
MLIASISAYSSVNALARSLGRHAFQNHQLLLDYLRWLDQSYGTTITCTLHADRSATIAIHGTHQFTLTAAQGGILVQWARPDIRYQSALQKLSAPGSLTQTADGSGWQFSVDTQHDSYLLRDLTDHLHQQ